MQTPYYIFDVGRMLDDHGRMSELLAPCEVHYCVKANGDPGLIAALSTFGSRFEVSSLEEWQLVRGHGVVSSRIICGIPVLSRQFIQEAYRDGCRYFVFDCPDALTRLCREAPEAEAVVRLRFPSIQTSGSGFGATPQELSQWIKAGRLNADRIKGLAFDLRKNFDPGALAGAFDEVESILSTWPSTPLSLVNIGGNFRLPDEVDFRFRSVLRTRLSALTRAYGVRLLAEIGRSIVKHSGTLMTTVLQVRRRSEHVDLYIDAGVSAGVSHEPTKVVPFGAGESVAANGWTKYRFFGPTCCHTELFSALLPYRIDEGDVLTLHGMGAYTVAKISRFHSLKPPGVQHVLEHRRG